MKPAAAARAARRHRQSGAALPCLRIGYHTQEPGRQLDQHLRPVLRVGIEKQTVARLQMKQLVAVPVRGGGGGGRGGPPPVPVDIDAQGEIAGLPNSTFSSARAVGAILADSPVCQECIVRQMFRYSYGRLETSADEKTIDGLFAQFKGSGFRFKNLLIALVQSPEFLREWNGTTNK